MFLIVIDEVELFTNKEMRLLGDDYFTVIREEENYIELRSNNTFHQWIIFKKSPDLQKKAVGEGDEENSNLDLFSLEMFENIAYIMAKHADATVLDTPEEWLDGFNTFSIYQVLPSIIELWGLNIKKDVESKKNSSNRP